MVYRPIRYEQMMKAAEGMDVRARRIGHDGDRVARPDRPSAPAGRGGGPAGGRPRPPR